MEVLALIPARCGSKSIIDKNIRDLAGKPMLAYSIEQALASTLITRTIVSTDSSQYAEIAKEYGAEIPFLRPNEYSTDTATDFHVFSHALEWLKSNENYEPELVIHLRPTYPIRTVDDIDNMILIMIENPDTDSIRSIYKTEAIPHKMWYKRSKYLIKPILSDIYESYNMPRQELPDIFLQNACIDVIRTKTITEKQSMSGDKIFGYEMNHFYDIDTENDFQLVMQTVLCNQNGKTFCFDIDGVIATIQPDNNYLNCEPISETITIINKLFDNGNYIILHTARGSATGLDWLEITQQQLTDWGVRFHKLQIGKPAADFYIDDKFISLEHLRKIIQLGESHE